MNKGSSKATSPRINSNNPKHPINSNNPNNPKKVATDKIHTNNNINKMMFIYNALQDGWTIRKVSDDNYEFTKPNIKKNVSHTKLSLKQFIKGNLVDVGDDIC